MLFPTQFHPVRSESSTSNGAKKGEISNGIHFFVIVCIIDRVFADKTISIDYFLLSIYYCYELENSVSCPSIINLKLGA